METEENANEVPLHTAETAETEEVAAPVDLTDEEKRLVRDYAVNDEEVRRTVISDYLARLKTADPVPAVMQGDAGAGPVYAPRTARDMREAAVLAEALLKRK